MILSLVHGIQSSLTLSLPSIPPSLSPTLPPYLFLISPSFLHSFHHSITIPPSPPPLLNLSFLLLSLPPSISLSLPSGWLVDTTGSYTATFFLSGAALMTSSLVLCMVAGIRRCHRRTTSRSSTPIVKDAKHEPLPLSLADQSDCYIAVNKKAKPAVNQIIASKYWMK